MIHPTAVIDPKAELDSDVKVGPYVVSLRRCGCCARATLRFHYPKMTTVHRNGKTYYVYADPTKKEIYVGTEAENKRYQQLRKANNLAEEKSYSEAMGDWGTWEPFGY
jgi:acyl-[acyl carrier protein]--UDP-N-acetylglucosamine O-acyltransferase